MQKTKGPHLPMVRTRTARRVCAADRMGAVRGGSRAGSRQFIMCSEVIMRVVLIENPKFFAGLLRMLFGIKKEKQTIG